jgi:hypothetical protein
MLNVGVKRDHLTIIKMVKLITNPQRSVSYINEYKSRFKDRMISVFRHVSTRTIVAQESTIPTWNKEISKPSNPMVVIAFSNDGKLSKDDIVAKPFVGATKSITADDSLLGGRLLDTPFAERFKITTNVTNCCD